MVQQQLREIYGADRQFWRPEELLEGLIAP